MIYTITLNPAIDHIIYTNNDFELGKTNYYNDSVKQIGGKGLNISIVLSNLGVKSTTLGFLGKNNSDIFINKLNEFNINNDFDIIKGENRTNLKIKNLDKNQETELNGNGIIVDEKEITTFLSKLKNLITKNDIVVATGSVGRNVPKDIYKQIGKICNTNKSMFICDATNELLNNALIEKPFLIKPNLDEIYSTLNLKYKNDPTINELKNLFSKLRELGARNVLLSRGSWGSVYFEESGSVFEISTANGKLKNSVGSGDSMMAGVIYGIVNSLSVEEILKYGAAAGAATAFTEWLATNESIKKYKNDIKIIKI